MRNNTSVLNPGNTSRVVFVFTLVVLVLLNPFGTRDSKATASLQLTPTPSLSPQEVVEFQLRALRAGGSDGIAATFRFASPANKSVTGPLERFSGLFDNAQYNPMIGHHSADVVLIGNDGKTALLGVTLIDAAGNPHRYRYRLSLQSEQPYKNCWMTDAVVRVKQPGKSA